MFVILGDARRVVNAMGIACLAEADHDRFPLFGERPKNLAVVSGGQRHQFLHVGRSRLRKGQFRGRFAHVHDETFEAARGGKHEHSCRCCSFDSKAMWDLARSEDVRSWANLHLFAVGDKSCFTFEYIKRLIFGVMQVIRRGEPSRDQLVDQSEGAARGFGSGLDECKRVQKPPCRSFVFAKPPGDALP